jgi:hypothetical protein
MKSSDFHKALQYLEREDAEDDALPESLADELDANEDARRVLEGMATVDPSLYDLRRLHKAVQHDVHVLTDVWNKVKSINAVNDSKLARLKGLLTGELKGRKVIIFSYYKDTARYLYRHLGDPQSADASEFCKLAGDVLVRRMDSGNHPDERVKTVQAFAPKAMENPNWWAQTERLISSFRRMYFPKARISKIVGICLIMTCTGTRHVWFNEPGGLTELAQNSMLFGFTICFRTEGWRGFSG